MYTVYVLQSIKHTEAIYIHTIHNISVEEQLKTLNSPVSMRTTKYKPWKLIFSLDFSDEAEAKEFENDLKSQIQENIL